MNSPVNPANTKQFKQIKFTASTDFNRTTHPHDESGNELYDFSYYTLTKLSDAIGYVYPNPGSLASAVSDAGGGVGVLTLDELGNFVSWEVVQDFPESVARPHIEEAHGKILAEYGATGDCPPGLDEKIEEAYANLISLIHSQIRLQRGSTAPDKFAEMCNTYGQPVASQIWTEEAIGRD